MRRWQVNLCIRGCQSENSPGDLDDFGAFAVLVLQQ